MESLRRVAPGDRLTMETAARSKLDQAVTGALRQPPWYVSRAVTE